MSEATGTHYIIAAGVLKRGNATAKALGNGGIYCVSCHEAHQYPPPRWCWELRGAGVVGPPHFYQHMLV